MVLRRTIGAILGMDHIGTEVRGDKVTYIYKSAGLFARKRVQEVKAKVLSVLSPPMDLPTEVRVRPVKRGVVVKEFVVEVDVPARRFEVK